MTFPSNPQDRLEARLTRVLEAPPPFTIPIGFAAHTASLAKAQLSVYSPSAPAWSFSRLSIRLALAVLLVAMLLLPWVAGQSSPFSIGSEVLLALELAALTTWLSLRPHPIL